MLRITGFQITRTIDRLVYDLLLILRETLSDQKVDILRNKNDLDILNLQILELLSRPLYATSLLWRNYHASPTIKRWYTFKTHRGQKLTFSPNDEAINYWRGILCRRLGLANNLRNQPSHMHRLLQAGCRYGPMEAGWGETTIKRDTSVTPRNPDMASFRRTTEVLNQQRKQWILEQVKPSANGDKKPTTVAERRHKEFGPLWLIVGDYIQEIIPELSLLYDVLQTFPAPLAMEFAEDPAFQRHLQWVIQSLNDRYGLLRSCGLDPNTWLDSEDLSMNKLKDIKKLRRCQQDLACQRPEATTRDNYEICFNLLKAEIPNFAGCPTFQDFLETDVGAQVVFRGFSPLPEEPIDTSDPQAESDLVEIFSRLFDSSLADNDGPWERGHQPDSGGSAETEYQDDESLSVRINPDADEEKEEEESNVETKVESRIVSMDFIELSEHFHSVKELLARDPLLREVVRLVRAGCNLRTKTVLKKLRCLIEQNDLHKRRFGELSDQEMITALCDYARTLIEEQSVN